MPASEASFKPRVTQSDVARVAGVHNTTVSLSLRNSPSIPAATRERIRAIATDLGYYPDPTLQALVAYRKGRAPKQEKETLAYITHGITRWGWRSVPEHERNFVGAQLKAASLGYQLEHFWLGEPGLTPRRLSSMLYHRGIKGALIRPQTGADKELSEVDWSRLSVVQIGGTPSSPELHRVTGDCAAMVRAAVRRVRAVGFERVGLILTSWWDHAADNAWSSGFLTEQRSLPSSERVPLLTLGGIPTDWNSGLSARPLAVESAAIGRWFEAHRPTAILAFSPTVRTQLQQLALPVSDEVAYVDLCLDQTDRAAAGFRHNHETVGEVAMAALVSQLQLNSCGVPPVATTTLVSGTWVDGVSLRMIRPPETWSDNETLDRDGLMEISAGTA